MFLDIRRTDRNAEKGKRPYTLPNPKQTVPESGERFAKTDNATGTLPVSRDSALRESESSPVVSGKSQPLLGPLSPHL